MKHCILIAIALNLLVLSKAQIPSPKFFTLSNLDTDSVTTLYFDYLGYLKDNEYFANIVKGYTLIGQQARFLTVFHPSQGVNLHFGLAYNHFFGSKKYSFYPIFRLSVKLKRLTLVSGSLYSNAHHRMHDLIYDFERVMTEPSEWGLQAIYQQKTIYFQTWVNWRQFIFYKSTYPERFVVGANLQWFIDKHASHNTKILLQTIITHNGGQIDSANSLTVTGINTLLGAKNELYSSQNLRMQLAGYVLIFYEPTNSMIFGTRQGIAMYVPFAVKYKDFTFKTGTWFSAHYVSLLGNFYFSDLNFFNYTGSFGKAVQTLTLDFTHWLNPQLGIKLGAFAYLYNFSQPDYGFYFFLRYRWKHYVSR